MQYTASLCKWMGQGAKVEGMADTVQVALDWKMFRLVLLPYINIP